MDEDNRPLTTPTPCASFSFATICGVSPSCAGPADPTTRSAHTCGTHRTQLWLARHTAPVRPGHSTQNAMSTTEIREYPDLAILDHAVHFVPLGGDLPNQEGRHGSLRFGASNGIPLVKKT